MGCHYGNQATNLLLPTANLNLKLHCGIKCCSGKLYRPLILTNCFSLIVFIQYRLFSKMVFICFSNYGRTGLHLTGDLFHLTFCYSPMNQTLDKNLKGLPEQPSEYSEHREGS